MNIIWTSIVIIGIFLISITTPDLAFSSLVMGGEKAVFLSLKLLPIYAVWLGFLKLIELSELDKIIAKFLSPLLCFLFGNISENSKKQISTNITANVFGIGSASTPSGMKAMELLYEESNHAKKPTSAMMMLVLLNTANLQLIPSTIIGLRLLSGSLYPSNIIIPSVIVSVVSIAIGIVLIKITTRKKCV